MVNKMQPNLTVLTPKLKFMRMLPLLEVVFCMHSVTGKIMLKIKSTDMYGVEKEEFIAVRKVNLNKTHNLLLTKSTVLRTWKN